MPHSAHAHNYGLFEQTLIVTALLALGAYLIAVKKQHQKGRSWSKWRTAQFVAGILLLVTALLPDVVNFAHQDLRGHMLQHLLLGMLAPLALVFAAPITLALRTLPAEAGRRLVQLLRSNPMRIISQPFIALLLNVGGMYLLYLSPLYMWSQTSALVHGWVHLHFLLAGCLFTWVIAGPDPAPHRPRLQTRLAVLFVSMAAHAVLAKIMYAYGWPRGTGHSDAEAEAAAVLMYYGGDLAELLLLAALLTLWYQKRGRTAACANSEGDMSPKGVRALVD